MLVKYPGPLALALIILWFAPAAVALGIHTHELLEHAHHHEAAGSGMAVHAEGHHHPVPSFGRDVAPPVRFGKQAPPASSALAAPSPSLAAVPGPRLPARAANFDRCAPRDGPSLLILHCSFLI